MRALVLLLAPSIAAAEPPTIKPAEVPDAVAKAIAATPDPKAQPGSSSVIANFEKPDVAALATTLRGAFAKQPVTIVDDRAHATSVVLVVEAKSKARVVITLAPERGTISVVAKPTANKPPGACVAIPTVKHEIVVHSSAIGQDGEHHHGSTNWLLETSRLFDVDGDALGDMFVPVPPARGVCPEDFSYRIYAMRGTCGYDLGVVGPGTFVWDTAYAPFVNGYRAISIESRKSNHGSRGIPEMTETKRTFGVTGTTYKQTAIQNRGGVCHHCATWHCNKR